MAVEQCYGFVCFYPLDSSGQKFFGFSEFLAGLALMVLAWTTADIRYKFRVRTAPLPLQTITFSVVAAVGFLTLMTDLWRAEQWLVPRGNLLSPGAWQALLGLTFLFTFLLWAWFAFIRPPTYGKLNAKRYARALYRIVIQGSSADLAIIADELSYSIQSVMRHASDPAATERMRDVEQDGQTTRPLPDVEGYANQLVLLIADRRLCRAIVASSPMTALAVFQQLGDAKRPVVNIRPFAANIVTEAILNKDSFLFHEVEGYDTGLMGYQKPLSQAMFSNYQMVLTINSMLDPDYPISQTWDVAQWKAYSRAVLMTMSSFIADGHVRHEPVFARAIDAIQSLASGIYKIDGTENTSDDSVELLDVAVNFIQEVVKCLNESPALARVKLRERDERHRFGGTLLDSLARAVAEIVYSASAVKSPRWTCWTVQHNSVWSDLFSFTMTGPAARIVQHKARRLIYADIAEMSKFPNYKGARILGFCLNVMGWRRGAGSIDKESRALRAVVVAWVKRNYKWLHDLNPSIAQACLVEGIAYDAKLNRLMRTHPAFLRPKPRVTYLQLSAEPRPSGVVTD